MVTLHEVITFLVSMQISISSLQTHNVNRCGRSRHLARKLSLRRKRSSPNVFEMAATETITSIILIKLIRVSLGKVRYPRRVKIVVIDVQNILKQMLMDFICLRVNRVKKSGIVHITSSVNSRVVFFCVSKIVSVSCAYTQGKREQFSGFTRTLDAINNVFRKFSAFHDETGRLNVDGMNIISNDGSNKLNRSRKARVSYKVQRTINASLNAATSTRAVSSNPNFVTRQKIEIIFG